MMYSRHATTIAILICSMMLNGCGSDAHGAFNTRDEQAPGAVTALSGNAGDGAVSLGWGTPDTGTTPLTYNIAISPDAPNATITSDNTHALIQGLSNDTSYTFAVTAKNSAGESSVSTILLKPSAVTTDISAAVDLDNTGDTNNSAGISDASLLNVAESNTIWMTYSSVSAVSTQNFSQSTSIASSDDNGASFTYLKTINQSSDTTITPRTIAPCPNVTCNGRWAYEMPFLVEDSTDDPSKRFKLFALKYFIYLPEASRSEATFYSLGAIVMKTGASPDSISSSTESVVLSWDSTPRELSATNNIKNIDANLNECTALIEGGATAYRDALDFVFACPNGDGTQKIVLLRSDDHAKTFKYVSTPLTAADAAFYNARYFSAPSLLPTESNSPVLMATPIIDRVIGSNATQAIHSGCAVFPFADEEAGKLFRRDSMPISILDIDVPAATNHVTGACAWERGAGGSGILMNDNDQAAPISFNILRTEKPL